MPMTKTETETEHQLGRLREWWNWSGPRPEVPVTAIGIALDELDRLARARDEAVGQVEGMRKALEKIESDPSIHTLPRAEAVARAALQQSEAKP